MRNVWKWVVIIGGILILAFLVALFLFGRGIGYRWFPGYMPMMNGPWQMGPNMFGFRGGGLSGGWTVVFGIIFVLLALLALVVLVGVGIFFLVRASNRAQTQPAVSAKTCPSCGKPVQADWANCPYCGTKL